MPPVAKPQIPYSDCRDCGVVIAWLTDTTGRRLPPHEMVGEALVVIDGRAEPGTPVFVRHRCSDVAIAQLARQKAAEAERQERNPGTTERIYVGRLDAHHLREHAWSEALPRPCPTCGVAVDERCLNLSPKAEPGTRTKWPHPPRRIAS